MIRTLLRIAGLLAGALFVVALAVVGKAWYDSRLPGTYSVMDYGSVDYGGGPAASHDIHHGRSIALLRGPRVPAPPHHYELTARTARVRLTSGRTVNALTFNGMAPGPELRVRQGDVIEVTLVNEDVAGGVTIHWHGVDLQNAEDGVAGVTQDAVLPGERYTYHFAADQVGTFWYHSHQVSSTEVKRGLFGALVIEPREGPTERLDWALSVHTFDGVPTINADDGGAQRAVPPGTSVRLRLVNTDSFGQRLALDGTRFRVAAIDGTELNGPEPIEGQALVLAAGGRMDVSFPMPTTPVQLSLGDTNAGVVLSADGTATPQLRQVPEQDFDPLSYGEPAPTPFDAKSTFDRRFEFRITRKPGFLDGRPGLQWAINGGIYPDVPTFVVAEGDLVEITITNDTKVVHPMHLHGHHVLVLSRDGVPKSGSPWWSDTLNVLPGESYVVAFRAVNPGIWMDHCHNLPHAAAGLTMHLAYAGFTTPFLVGGHHHNTPE
jgi:FtsP/CotA-like multicopper oxidase with cupredoxin domain